MSQSGKASIKRGKPSYFMSILGVTLVLFLLGIIGWLVINANKLGDYFKENVEVRTYLLPNMNPKDSAALMQYISAQPYMKSIEYVDKEAGKKIYMKEENEDWDKVLEANPLPNAIYFTIKRKYVNLDSLNNIKKDLELKTYVTEVKYPEALVGKLNKNIRILSICLLVIVIIISLVVIFLIDNTIRLAMFSNRFLIKTMQMVGATRNFIARPLNVRAIINGAISGVIASFGLFIAILIVEKYVDWLKTLHDNGLLFLLFFLLIVIGISITLFSTYRSVLKYLRMKLDDLY
ncbi:MAG TPA: permease-like cell division protein FtsX [Chitinophagaceae bacterium]|nr:permease-like cell division protein FtsX [Chitinophagaceae bacterium]